MLKVTELVQVEAVFHCCLTAISKKDACKRIRLVKRKLVWHISVAIVSGGEGKAEGNVFRLQNSPDFVTSG